MNEIIMKYLKSRQVCLQTDDMYSRKNSKSFCLKVKLKQILFKSNKKYFLHILINYLAPDCLLKYHRTGFI